MILSDKEITELAVNHNMITNFIPDQVKKIDNQKVISFGTSSYGYDIRLGNEMMICTGKKNDVYDPKNPDENLWRTAESEDFFTLPAHSTVLAKSVEIFKMPHNVTGHVVGKSTYARCGIICNVTPLEAGWKGQVTLEFINTMPCQVKMYVNEGCCQVLFFRGRNCKTSYADRNGKYLGQTGITLSKV